MVSKSTYTLLAAASALLAASAPTARAQLLAGGHFGSALKRHRETKKDGGPGGRSYDAKAEKSSGSGSGSSAKAEKSEKSAKSEKKSHVSAKSGKSPKSPKSAKAGSGGSGSEDRLHGGTYVAFLHGPGEGMSLSLGLQTMSIAEHELEPWPPLAPSGAGTTATPVESDADPSSPAVESDADPSAPAADPEDDPAPPANQGEASPGANDPGANDPDGATEGGSVHLEKTSVGLAGFGSAFAILVAGLSVLVLGAAALLMKVRRARRRLAEAEDMSGEMGPAPPGGENVSVVSIVTEDPGDGNVV